MLTTKAIELFLNSRCSKGLSLNTIRWYKGILRVFALAYPKLPKTPEVIESFLSSLKAGDERRHGYYRTLRCFYRFLTRRFNIKNPMNMIDPPRRLPKQPRVLMPNDINRLLSSPLPPEIKMAIMFLGDTGARLGELATLDIDNLRETPWGFVADVKGKTGTRAVPISYETYHNLIVNLPFSYGKVWLGRLIAKAMKTSGISGSAHTLRHTFATLWEGDELPLQSIMGHRNLSTTRGYRHLRTKILSEQHNQYSPLRMVLSSTKNMLQ